MLVTICGCYEGGILYKNLSVDDSTAPTSLVNGKMACIDCRFLEYEVHHPCQELSHFVMYSSSYYPSPSLGMEWYNGLE